MKQRALGLLLVAAVAGSLTAVPAAAASAASSRAASPAVTAANPLQGFPIQTTTGTVFGTVTGFVVQNGQLLAVTQITDPAGNVLGTVNIPVALAPSSGTCQILHLVIGPIDLNLLGLQVTTNRIVVDITAHSGPGNLLGNLLCAVAHLLDNSGFTNQALTTIANLLNQILHLLG